MDNQDIQVDVADKKPTAAASTPCRACHGLLDPRAATSEVVLTTLGERRHYHARCLRRVARIPGPFPLEAA